MSEHTPVLLEEVLAALQVRESGRYLDATFGRGGHTAAILERVGKEGRVVAIDRDPDAIRAGRERFGAQRSLTEKGLLADGRLTLVLSPFSLLAQVVAEAGAVGGFDGVLLDLGVSSPQLDNAARGFSFVQDGPLDMRMNNASGMTAADWLAKAPEHDIARVIREFGEERFAKRIARAIVVARGVEPIVRTSQLSQIVAGAVPMREPGKHPATRTFQAIRIHVNQELDEIEAALEASLLALAPHGRLCVISFHSLEDGIVKRFMQKHSQEDPVYAGLPEVPAHARPKLRRVGKAIHPSAVEVDRNPRARSSIMRVAEKVAA
ncbi:16S rRNA (cytosine1402-N4)-methyltransferase [Povalibacter uvarum]|uniref:Ribosomal RNA small subunit methyltransferase H n=1 Tax=Povalibacter uvarum TaxID=732238 RepID=A0A841HS53_9GAMM|nr:16S rRNA (cytosine(1402)-N(4))-methyltransferase RsmH [Povalibacter uvarum]MBB6094888.1 16S rRNA (cytosine1402-N4)-methyltransferase [Povalibacter uvarum]